MLNRVTVMGRLTEDPELRHTQGGRAVCRFTLAVARDYARKGEEVQTDFPEAVAWGKTAEFVCVHFRRGERAAVTGSLETEVYTDGKGVRRKRTEIRVSQIYFVEPGPGRKRNEDGNTEVNEENVPEDLPF